MTLCLNRFEPAGSPSTCTLDSFIVPLPSCLLTAALGLKVARSLVRQRRGKNTLIQKRVLRAIELKVYRRLLANYILFLIVAFAINLLQIARLACDHQGVALLPFNLLGLVIALALVPNKLYNPNRSYSSLFLRYWALWTLFQMVNVVRLRRLSHLYPAKGSFYPNSDRLTDNIMLLGLYALFFLFETCLIHCTRRLPLTQESISNIKKDADKPHTRKVFLVDVEPCTQLLMNHMITV